MLIKKPANSYSRSSELISSFYYILPYNCGPCDYINCWTFESHSLCVYWPTGESGVLGSYEASWNELLLGKLLRPLVYLHKSSQQQNFWCTLHFPGSLALSRCAVNICWIFTSDTWTDSKLSGCTQWYRVISCSQTFLADVRWGVIDPSLTIW